MSFCGMCCGDSRPRDATTQLLFSSPPDVQYNFAEPKTVDDLEPLCMELDIRINEIITTYKDTVATTKDIIVNGLEHVDRLSKDSSNSYVGFVRNGVKEGFGRYTYNKSNNIKSEVKSSLYEGQWRDNKANGIGRLRDETGEYLGYWKNGEKHGVGKETWFADKTVFRGVYDKGQKEGIGIYEWGDGSKYQGQLSDNEITGWGTLTDEYDKGQKEGIGIYEWGVYDKGQKEGVGIYEWGDGSK